MGAIAEIATFLREFRATFKTTGAVLPSGRFLARAITRPAREAGKPARWLEVGPGTGAFTDVLVEHLGAEDTLVLVELNDRFVDTLRQRLASQISWAAKQERIRLIHDTIEALDPTEQFDAVVCGLPFNNFDPADVERLVDKMLAHVRPGGTFSFFEYLAIRSLKAPFVGRAEKERLDRVAAALSERLDRLGFAHDRVFANAPPAVAHHLRVPAGQALPLR